MKPNKRKIKRYEFTITPEMLKAAMLGHRITYINDEVEIIFHPNDESQVVITREEYEGLMQNSFHVGVIQGLKTVVNNEEPGILSDFILQRRSVGELSPMQKETQELLKQIHEYKLDHDANYRREHY